MGERRKRYAVLVGQADESYQQRFITGFLRKAFADNTDVCIFSMYLKYQDTSVREQADSNIFSLMEPSAFDGAVILKDSIQTAGAAERIEKRLKESFDKPVLVVEKPSEYFPYVITDGYQAMYDIVTHMIVKHGFKDIGFLSGKKWHEHSIQRMQAYKDAMHDHGLEVNEDRIVHGDFWYQSGEMCAEQYISKQHSLPEAVVCANDQMAIGLCKALSERGIRIPEDVAVAGYDTTYEGQTSPKSLTSTLIPADEMGEYAHYFLKTKAQGIEPEPYDKIPTLVSGESCGCKVHTIAEYSLRRDRWGTPVSEEGYSSIFNKMEENLIMQQNMEDFAGALYSYCYQLTGAKSFHICLTNWWKYTEQDAGLHLRNEGYPDKMTYAIRYSGDRKNNKLSTNETFETRIMLPDLYERRDKPTAFIFTPLFFETECFGYAVINYGDEARSYDEDYRRWINSVMRAFEALRRNLVIANMQQMMKKFKVSKFGGVNSAYEMMSDEEKLDHDTVGQILDNNLLTYHFQPIVCAKDGSIYAYEALMRSNTERPISPLRIIKFATMQGRLEDVERATFVNVLSIIDKNKQRLGNAKVFINSIPGVRLHDTDNDIVEGYLKANSEMVVVELTEEAELSDEELERLKDYLKNLGIEIAVDDYGTGYSNVSNLLRYMPNYVKIDRALLSGIQSDSHKQHFVREIISFCHDNDILALAEGVETSDELATVIHLGADLIQGFYTAKPSPMFAGEINTAVRGEIKTYYQEFLDGTTKKTYTAGKTNRISLGALVRDRCTDIVIGQGTMVYKDISIIGAPSLQTDIHLRVATGYIGRISFENVYLSNVKGRPCIDIGENCDVTLSLQGSNILANAGICVPESSRLVIEGDGDLSISCDNPQYYCIGNGLDQKCGEIVFEQDGIIEIQTHGMNGICIGAGRGGTIRINSGQYKLHVTGDMGVGIGSVTDDIKLEINSCNILGEIFVSEGVGIGSRGGSVDISLTRSSYKLDVNGNTIVGIGTIKGESASISMLELSGEISMRADNSTGYGALEGSSRIYVAFASMHMGISGKNALALGGRNENTDIVFNNVDTRSDVHNLIDKDTYAPPERIRLINGRRTFMVNDKEIERKLTYDFND
ncbi:MAG: EAL domain-containing protein [Ruminococcus sp.]|nr:EAL domain-containing protein [Ruminococcus sp.]